MDGRAEPLSPILRERIGWPLTLATALVAAIVGAVVTFCLMRFLAVHRFPSEVVGAAASIFVAAGTLSLAYFTWQSVIKTSEVIANENSNHDKAIENDRALERIRITVNLVAQYFQSPVQVSSDIQLTVHTASSQITIYAGQMDELKRLKEEFYKNQNAGDEVGDKRQRDQYKVLIVSFSVVLNFYMYANQMLRQGILDERLFMNTFARGFMALYLALLEVHPVIVAVPIESIMDLGPFKNACQAFLASAEKAKSSAEDAQCVL
jgi:hypothetical protein